jgi:outer membrane receptor protein involved in Fe transport
MGYENKAILGVDLIKEEIKSSSFSDFPDPFFPFIQNSTTGYEREIIGIYLHDDFSITPQTIFNFGVRYDNADFEYNNITIDYVANTTTTQSGKKNFGQWSPKASLTHLINDNVSAYISYAKSFRFPNRDELTGFLGLTPELDPEKADNYELGLKVDLGDKIKGTVALYHMNIEDEILYAAPNVGAFAFGQNENFDEIRHRGVEISFESNIIPRTTVIGSYTYTETEIKTGTYSGSELPITPHHMGHISATIDVGMGFSLWNQARFVGKRYLANDLSNTITRLPAFEDWDVKLNYQHGWKNVDLSIFIGVNNILDEEYEEFGGVGGFPFGSRIGFNPSPERNYLGGITINWNFD